MQLKTNESTVDRMARVVVGLILAALGLSGAVSAPWLYVVWLLAVLALVTGSTGFCAVYALFRLSTRRVTH